MNINLKILSTNAQEGTAVVRYWTDMISEHELAAQVVDGVIMACRTDYNVWLPTEPLQGADLINYFMQFAPVKLFENMEAHAAGMPVDTSAAQALAGATQVRPADAAATLDSVKKTKKGAVAVWRYMRETGGVVVGTTRIATDPASQAKIAGALASLQQGFITSTPWKGDNGWVDVDLDQMTAIARAVAEHVSSCFAQEKALSDQVDACTTIDAVNAIVIGGMQ